MYMETHKHDISLLLSMYLLHLVLTLPPPPLPTSTLGMFLSMFWIAYLISPRFCHRFVGYLEEEAVRTYTHCIEVRRSTIASYPDYDKQLDTLLRL